MKVAYAELRLTLARLLFDFDISLADERDRWDWGEQNTYIVWVSNFPAVLIFHGTNTDVQVGKTTP